MLIKKKPISKGGLDTACIGINEYDCFKVTQLSEGRVEMVFLHNREIEIGQMVKVRAVGQRLIDKGEPLKYITRNVTGSKRRKKDGLWEIYVITKGVLR